MLNHFLAGAPALQHRGCTSPFGRAGSESKERRGPAVPPTHACPMGRVIEESPWRPRSKKRVLGAGQGWCGASPEPLRLARGGQLGMCRWGCLATQVFQFCGHDGCQHAAGAGLSLKRRESRGITPASPCAAAGPLKPGEVVGIGATAVSSQFFSISSFSS